jgi:hypothetical protein
LAAKGDEAEDCMRHPCQNRGNYGHQQSPTGTTNGPNLAWTPTRNRYPGSEGVVQMPFTLNRRR